MKRTIRWLPVVFVALTALALTPSDRQGGDDDEEVPFDEASLYFELNDTDGDLGIHSLIDGEAWKSLEIEDMRGRAMLDVSVRGRLRRQGLTELFFESSEPPFDELPPEHFFRRFPQGIYEIEADALEGFELESEVLVTHVMPGPPENVQLSGMPAAENCDAEPLPTVGEPIIVSWDPVTESHPEIGTPGEEIEVEFYQFVVETEDLELSVNLPDDVTEFEIPFDLLEPGTEVKFEILVREAVSGNQTAVESCFLVE